MADYPVAFAQRPLTLPELVLSPSLDFTYDRSITSAVNLGIGLALGATEDLTFHLSVNAPLQSASIQAAHQFTGGMTYRFLHIEAVDIGGRLELGALSNDSSAPDSALLRSTLMLPVVLRAARIFRLDTGLAFSFLFPVDGNTTPDGGLMTFGTDPYIAGPGVPVKATIQIVDPLFVGIDTGFGMLTFREETVDDLLFAPLGFRLGGTIPMKERPLADLVASFNFPFFLLSGDGEPPVSEVWQVGLALQAYAPI